MNRRDYSGALIIGDLVAVQPLIECSFLREKLEKKRPEMTPASDILSVRVSYRYPATIPAKLADAISRRLPTDQAFPATVPLKSRYRRAHKSHNIARESFQSEP
jgi:hypothetical protein